MTAIERMQSLPIQSEKLERFSQVNQKTPQNLEAVKKLSEEFESIFLEIVLKSMRESVGKSELVNGGNGEQIFQSMLDSEYAKNLASERSTGLASTIEEALLHKMGERSAGENAQKAAGLAQYSRQATDKAVSDKPQREPSIR